MGGLARVYATRSSSGVNAKRPAKKQFLEVFSVEKFLLIFTEPLHRKGVFKVLEWCL